MNIDGLPPDQAIAQAAAVGAKSVRTFVRWDEIEPTAAGVWNAGAVARLDSIAAAAAPRSIKVLVVVLGAPQWASGNPDPLVPPADPAKYARFVGAYAAHFKGKIAAWEIWNEPDGTEFWHGPQPSAPAYTALLQASYRTIKAADPAAQVYAGPLIGNDYAYLEQLYADGAAGSFDAVSVHTDTACSITAPDSYYREADGRIGQFSFLGFREVHDVMVNNGDGAKPIVMSELGWAATATQCARGAWAGKKAAGVNEATQATNLKLAYHCLSAYPYVSSAMWFSMKDSAPVDSELNRYGLLRADLSQRPSFAALADIARNGDLLHGECGDFTPPQITVLAPGSDVQYDKHLLIRVAAHDAGSPLGRISLYANGQKIRSFTAGLQNDRPLTINWMGARSLPLGPVTVTVEALDMFGNVTKRDITVTHTDVRALPLQSTQLTLHVSGKGLTRTVAGRVAASSTTFPVSGRVQLLWQYASKTGWKTLHRASRPADKPFSYLQTLVRPGHWRVIVQYGGDAPFAQSTATSEPLTATVSSRHRHRRPR